MYGWKYGIKIFIIHSYGVSEERNNLRFYRSSIYSNWSDMATGYRFPLVLTVK